MHKIPSGNCSPILIGDITFAVRRHLAVEIDFPPLFINQESQITCFKQSLSNGGSKWPIFEMDTNVKTRSAFRPVTLLLIYEKINMLFIKQRNDNQLVEMLLNL
jgi:hypothetical protein